MRKLLVPTLLAAIAIAVLATDRAAQACGSIDLMASMYANGNRNGKERALKWLGSDQCGARSIIMLTYRGAASDRKLLFMLRDAVTRRIGLRWVAPIFYAYRCLPSVHARPGYARVRGAAAALADKRKHRRCPTPAQMRRWLVVKSAAELRRLPREKAPATGLVRAGNVVSGLGRAGKWVRVRSWRGETGWMPRASVRKYP